MEINRGKLASKIADDLLDSEIYFLPKSDTFTHNEIKMLLVKIIKKTLLRELKDGRKKD